MMLTFQDYPKLLTSLASLPPSEAKAHCRNLCRTDLYFLLAYALGRKDMRRQWLFDRCREVQAEPDSHLDLWAREHYKSTIITFGKAIQDILASHGDNPLPQWPTEVTIGIFSHTRPIAKAFLRQIKQEFEANKTLAEWFPDIIWDNPKGQAPKWSEDEGIVLKRKSNPKESTVEAWGVVDGQPVSKHFVILNYDDIVVPASVTTPDQIAKTTEMLELSYNLGSDGGKRRFIGTRYHFNDTYRTILDRQTAKPRIYPATVGGQIDGEPVLMSRESLFDKRRDMGPYTYACQMLQNPVADASQGFKREWLRHHDGLENTRGLNIYMIVDPANSKRKESDFTAIWVLGYAGDGNVYVLDIVRDRLNLTERCRRVMDLHRKWKPIRQNGVRYERYGLQADIEHLKTMQVQENYRFDVTEVGGHTPKVDRIRRLIPWFEQGRLWLPQTFNVTAEHDGRVHDLVHDFIEDEYMAFPVAIHDDMLDSLARMAEPEYPMVLPKTALAQPQKVTYSGAQASNWMG